MSDTPPADSEPTSPPAADLEQILDLNFVPDWARSAPDQQGYSNFQESRAPRRGGGGRDERRPQRGAPRSAAAGRPMPRRPSSADSDASGGERPRHPARPFEGRDRRDREPFPDAPSNHRIEVSFIPERRQLGVLVRKIRGSHRAFPLSKLAELLASRPEFCEVKFESLPTAEGVRPEPLFQCKETRAVFLTEEAWQSYAIKQFMEAHFERIEEEIEAPRGVFTCVARCGRTGELLGPPNYHAYNARLREIWQSRFHDLTLEDYSRRIELVHEPELVEQWKQQASRRTVYKARAEGAEAAPVEWAEARAQFLEKFAVRMAKRDPRVVAPQAIVMESADPWLKRRVEDAFGREQRNPVTLLRALRPALRHMGMAMFRPGGRDTYVTPVAPHPIDPAHAVDKIHAVLEHLQAHPGCTRDKLVEALSPGSAPDSEEAHAFLQPLGWLVERGNVIEFFNGALALPGPAPRSS